MPPPSKGPKQRRATPRSRNGCESCRQKRVKCGEERPACARCIRSGVVCSGYPSASPQTDTDEVIKSSQPARSVLDALTVVTYNIPFAAPGNPTDRKALHYFYSYVTKDLSGPLAIDFWDRIVPQRCQDNTVVRHAVIALSQAHFEHMATRNDGAAVSGSQQTAAVPHSTQSYMKASKALRRYIEHEKPISWPIILICNVIFHTIESLMGFDANATVHLEHGLRLYKVWRDRERDRGTKRDELVDDMTAVYAKLDLTITLADPRREPVMDYPDGLYPADDNDAAPSVRLRDAKDAYLQLSKVGIPAWQFLVRNRQYRHVLIDKVPQEIVAEWKQLDQRYKSWSRAMDVLEFEHATKSVNAKLSFQACCLREETLAILSTKIHYFAGRRMLAEGLQDPIRPRPWDKNPQKILRVAEEALSHLHWLKFSREFGQYGSFSAELGIGGILFLCAHRTSYPEVRARALALAWQYGRREGTTDLYQTLCDWAALPEPRRTDFILMLGEPGH